MEPSDLDGFIILSAGEATSIHMRNVKPLQGTQLPRVGEEPLVRSAGLPCCASAVY